MMKLSSTVLDQTILVQGLFVQCLLASSSETQTQSRKLKQAACQVDEDEPRDSNGCHTT